MLIGERIKQERIKRGLLQEELGVILGVTKVSICGYETGVRTPTLETFMLLVERLDLDPAYLLGMDHYIKDKNEPYKISISDNDLEIIKELKKHKELYNKICSDTKKTVDIINKRVN
ncbi:MAG: helix-turn-helix domain-containing protein [Ignavibacteriales bacterium]